MDAEKVLDEMCKFKVGQIVTTAMTKKITCKEDAGNVFRAPVRMVVLERSISQCHGGIQRVYIVQPQAENVLGDAGRINETALRALTQYESEHM